MTALLNATRQEVESALLSGMAPAQVVNELQEPMQGVLTIYKELRDNGRIGAANHNGAPPAPRPADGTADSLIKQGRAHDIAKIRALAEKARVAVAKLAEAIEADAGKAEARARVAKLEAELAAAKAALRGAPTAVKAPSAGGKACAKGCGRVIGAGRHMHEKSCKGAAS